MRVLVFAATILAVGFVPYSSAVSGEWMKRKWSKFKYEYHMNKIWPDPHILPDRFVTREPFDIMVAKGWQEQNTLTEDHFVPGQAGLSETGRLKVADILINSPPQYRTVYVERTWEGAATSERIASVEKYVDDKLADLGPVAVAETLRKRPGISAEYTNQVLQQWQATQPAPRLPAATVGSTEDDTP